MKHKKSDATHKVVCVACGRIIVASPNGHPRRHSPSNRLRSSGSGVAKLCLPLGSCDGMNYPGDAI